MDRFEHEYETPQIHWMRDRRHFAWEQEDRGHQRLRVIEANCDDTSIRNLVDEKTSTFIWTAHTENLGLSLVNWLADDELIYVSEMDGWRHLYLVSRDGNTVRRVTSGDYDVIKVEHVDEKGGWVYFLASPDNATQQYLYRSRLSGKSAAERVPPLSLTTRVITVSVGGGGAAKPRTTTT